ncbi:MAG: helix-turn-helix transcriptional regulator [Lachnospiraceae bacterium]|nr:helix-turn-helix transcriptional regulator [Lachnospiraceae bacterium]
MKINQNIYPYNIDVKKLPFYLTGIGGSEFQYHITRMDGYHWHQILFSAHGTGILKFDNITMTVAEGNYFFLPAGYPHEYYTEAPPWDVRWIAFDGYACAHVLGQFHMTKPIIIKPQDSTALQNMYNKMFTSQKSDRIYCDHSCSGLVYDYLLEFYRIMDHKTNKGRSDRNRILLPVLDYIDEHFRSDFPLTVLAEQAGISSQHLCRVFKETMNMRPNEYLTQRRLQEAKRLLQQNELPISEIAIQSGFPNAGYFSTVFKRSEGLTPQEYKLHIGLKKKG